MVSRHRELIYEMTRREITDRYAGHTLGTLWAVGHPFLLMGVYLLVFGFLYPMRLQLSEDVSQGLAIYILAGLIPWFSFSESLTKGTVVIVSNANLVKQVVFPTEILPLKGVLVACLTQLMTTSCLVLYMAITRVEFHWIVTFLPIVFVFQLLAMLGMSYFLAALGVYLRDLKEMAQVFLSVGIFLVPIFYFPSWVDQIWGPFKVVLWCNPFSHLIWCYQDVLYYGEFKHGWSWIILFLLCPVVFFGGFQVFQKLKIKFPEVL